MNDKILDDNFGANTSQLSDIQLVGMLSDRKKFHSNIIDKIEIEFISRKIDANIITELEEKHATFYSPLNEKTPPNSLVQIPLIILCICFLLLFLPILFFPVSISILFISIYTIKLKIEQGEQTTKKYWNYFTTFYLILVPIVILVGNLLGVEVS